MAGIETQDRFQTFEEFWPFYLGEHKLKANRALHFVGTSSAMVLLVLGSFPGFHLWLLAIPLVGYGPAWIGHFILERNRPATLRYPLWSLRGDLLMWARTLRGR